MSASAERHALREIIVAARIATVCKKPKSIAHLRTLYPDRHGRDNTGMCYICGDPALQDKVICPEHHFEYERGISPSFETWVLEHPDATWNRLYKCSCGSPAQPGDYLCIDCTYEMEVSK